MKKEIFTCPFCNKSITTKYGLILHLETKKKCTIAVTDEERSVELSRLREKPDNKYKCQWCDKMLKSASCLSQHKHVCKKSPKKKNEEENNGKCEIQEQDVEKLKTSSITNIHNTNNTTNNTTNNIHNTTNINNNTIIKIYNYGAEDFGHLIRQQSEHGNKVFSEKDTLSMLKRMFMDESRKSNQTIKSPKDDVNYILINQNGVWKPMKTNKLMMEIIKRCCNLLECYGDKHADDLARDMGFTEYNNTQIYYSENAKKPEEKIKDNAYKFLTEELPKDT